MPNLEPTTTAFEVEINFAITNLDGTSSTQKLIVLRNASDIGDAIAQVTAIFNSLSNVKFTDGRANIAVLECGIPSLV